MNKRSRQNDEGVPESGNYATELKRVYKEIDKFSNLLLPSRDAEELYWKTSRQQSMRPRQKRGEAGQA